jgi:hypothetical protein
LNRRQRRAAQHQEELAHAENCERNRERDDVVEQPEQEQAGNHVLPVELPQRDQHGRVEDPDAPRRVARKPKQGCGDEDHRERDKADMGLLRHQHVHSERAETEIDDADADLQ